MKVSKKFLNEYVKIEDLDFQEVAEKMVAVGNEYESIQKISSATNVVVGKVVSCENIATSDHLHACQIDVGEEILSIVCGAPNIKAGQKVMVAKVGAVLPGGMEIKKTTLAGVPSNGMVCSLGELGIESKYQSEEDKTGIHVLEEDAQIGEDAISYLDYDDEVIDFELTANRADLLSLLGMAYEVGAIYGREVTLPDITIHEIKQNIADEMTLQVETDACSIYLAKKVIDVTIKESPKFIQERLMASGIRPINNVVDISNYVMLEYGQPLHFFDADRLGHHILVRLAKDHEEIKTLDGKMRTLRKEDIVITNGKEPVALAGVMGGFDTEILENTKNIVIESAIFDSVKIRKTSKTILRSEASNRYEKGIDPARTEKAMYRACHLLEKYADAKVLSGMLVHDHTHKQEKEIVISLEKINAVLGMKLQKEDVIDALTRLQFKVTEKDHSFTILVPTRRLDVNIKEDIIEEIGRIHGFNQIKGTLPILEMRKGKRSPLREFTKKTRDFMQACGLQEVITYTLLDEEKSMQFVDEEQGQITLLNPMSEDRKYLRRSLLSSLLEVYDYHLHRQQKDVSIFEISNVYNKKETYQEKVLLSVLMSGKLTHSTWEKEEIKADFYALKGLVEAYFERLGITKGRYHFQKEEIKDLHPGRCAAIYIERTKVGVLGQVHPKLSKQEVYVFELDLTFLSQLVIRGIKAKEISKFPTITKDMAFIVDKNVPCEEIMKVMQKTGGRLLKDIEVFDLYQGDNIDLNEKSIAFSLLFEDTSKTLRDEEVMKIFDQIIQTVTKECHAVLRDK